MRHYVVVPQEDNAYSSSTTTGRGSKSHRNRMESRPPYRFFPLNDGIPDPDSQEINNVSYRYEPPRSSQDLLPRCRRCRRHWLRLSSQAQAKQAANAQTYDAVVLGAGPAGLIAAITAHDAGAKVVVLEKRDRPDGNAIFALGSICGWGTRHQAEQGIKDTADDFYAMMMDVPSRWATRLSTAATRITSPPASTGSKRTSASSSARSARCRIRVWAVPAASWAKASPAAPSLVQKFLAACAKRGIEVKYQHKAVELIHDDLYAVKGVKVATPEGFRTFMAKGGVCIATGGFGQPRNGRPLHRRLGHRMVLRGSKSTTVKTSRCACRSTRSS